MLIGATESDIGRWGWPLNDGVLADLLERVVSQRPRVIALDIYRDRPIPPGSDRLTAVLMQHPEIIWAFKMPRGADPGIPPPRVLIGTGRAAISDTPVDPGNIVRRALLYADDGKNVYLTVGMSVARRYLQTEGIGIRPMPDGSLQIGKALIAQLEGTRGPYVRLDSRGFQVLLDYKGGLHQFAHESVADALDHGEAAARVRDRAVIIGVAAESVKDDVITPFSTGFGTARPVRGMVVHALLADQLVREALYGAPILSGMPRFDEDVWIWVWAMAGAMVGIRLRRTVQAIVGVVAGLVTLGGIVYASFAAAGLLPGLPAAIAWVGAAGLSNRVLHAASNRERVRLRKSFEHYLPPVVIDRMIKTQTLPKLGGERREISVLFTDIANFTTLSETIEPEIVAALLSEYFAGACAAIFANGGLVYEFIGDAVLAFFGAPQEQSDHADRAVSAALALDAFAYGFSKVQRARGVDFGITRIGVHTGVALVGNIGTPERLKYTALGDMLNTGSRLEGLNKVIGTRICVSGETVRQSERHRFRPIGDFIHCHRLAEGQYGTLIVMAEK